MQQLNVILGNLFSYSYVVIVVVIVLLLAWGITRNGAEFLQSTVSGRLSIIEIRFVCTFIILFLLTFAITGYILEQKSGPETYQQWWLYMMAR